MEDRLSSVLVSFSSFAGFYQASDCSFGIGCSFAPIRVVRGWMGHRACAAPLHRERSGTSPWEDSSYASTNACTSLSCTSGWALPFSLHLVFGIPNSWPSGSPSGSAARTACCLDSGPSSVGCWTFDSASTLGSAASVAYPCPCCSFIPACRPSD